MKNLGRIVMFFGLLSLNIAQVNAQFTILPYTAVSDNECKMILDEFEVTQKFPTDEEAAAVSSDRDKADEAYYEAFKQRDAAKTAFEESQDNASEDICDSTKNPYDLSPVQETTCAKYYEAKNKYEEAQKSVDDTYSKSQTAIVKDIAARGMKDNLLGCAIKTGRISLNMLPHFVTYIANFLLSLVGIISVLFIVIGGYQYIYGGLVDQKDKGKKTITNAVLGLAVALLSWVVVQIIITAITS